MSVLFGLSYQQHDLGSVGKPRVPEDELLSDPEDEPREDEPRVPEGGVPKVPSVCGGYDDGAWPEKEFLFSFNLL